MTEEQKDKLVEYFDSIKDLKPEDMMNMVEEYMDDESIEIIVEHLEDFYGIEDDEELGMLAQIMISGYIAAKKIS